jgi:hypothetical protein
VPPLADKSVKSEDSTLPDPELNPLSNPLLAANLGRWAEVYFTNPPEKRSQAVAELLKALEMEAAAKSAAGESLAGAADHEAANKSIPPETVPETVKERSKGHPSITCSECGHVNDRGQKFCVMCGSSLTGSQEARVQPQIIEDRIAEEEPISPPEETAAEEGFSPENPESIFASGDERQQDEQRRYEGWQSRRAIDEEDLPHFAREPEAVPYRYRLYVGLIVAAVLGGLIYLARNRTDVFSGSQESPASRTMPAAPQPAAEAPAPAQSSAAPAPAPAKKAEAPAPPPTPTPQPEPSPQKSQQTARERVRPEPKLVPTTAPPALAARNGNGSEESAEAQKYLNQRDGADAAQWLWKAVAKGNAGATVTLADLYLRGNGVPKNCDQGRLLLDLAAKKGAKGAAEQLRNLQAFGCQ